MPPPAHAPQHHGGGELRTSERTAQGSGPASSTHLSRAQHDLKPRTCTGLATGPKRDVPPGPTFQSFEKSERCLSRAPSDTELQPDDAINLGCSSVPLAPWEKPRQRDVLSGTPNNQLVDSLRPLQGPVQSLAPPRWPDAVCGMDEGSPVRSTCPGSIASDSAPAPRLELPAGHMGVSDHQHHSGDHSGRL